MQELLKSGQAYNVRFKRKDDNRFKVIIDFQVETPKPTINLDNGVIGVDTNPDRIALANITADGNLVADEDPDQQSHFYASQDKR